MKAFTPIIASSVFFRMARWRSSSIYAMRSGIHLIQSAINRARCYRRSWLSGPHSEFIVIDTAPNASMIGVHLRPGGASAFFGLPLCELRNSVVELDTFWNCEAQNLRDQLLEAPGQAAKFRILENALLARWRRLRSASSRRASRTGIFQARARKSDTVGKVTAEVGLSPATAYRNLHRASRNDAKEILPRASISTSDQPDSAVPRAALDRDRDWLRLLRSGPLHQ